MSSIVIKIGADSNAYSAELDKIKKQTKSLEAGLAQVGKISAIAFAGTATAIGLAVNEAAKFEKISSQFEVLTGSVEKANAVLKDLADFSAGTPFQFDDIAKAGKQLIAFGIETDNVKDRLREIGDVSAATGAQFGEVTTIFGQIQAAGKLTGERLLQLQERAIPIGPALAKTLGIAESRLKDFVSQGRVSAADFNKAFASLSEQGGVAFGGLDKVSATLEGKISTLKDNFSLLTAEVGRQFLPVMKNLADLFISFFGFLRSNPEIAKQIAVFAGVAAAATATIAGVSGAALAFIKLRAAFLAVSAVAPKLALGIKGLVGATGIGLLLLIAQQVYENWNVIFPAMQSVIETFSKNVSKILGGLGNLLVGVFTLDLDKIKQGFEELKTVAVEGFQNAREAVKAANPEEEKPSLVPNTETEVARIQNNEAAINAEEERIKEEKIAAREAEIEEEFTRQEEDNERLTGFLANENNIKKQAKLEQVNTELQAEKKRRIQFQKDEQEFGKTYATFNKTLQSDRVKGAETAAGLLTKLQSSENSKQKAIGKAAARTQNAIDTAKGALAAYAALAGIPIVGPVLGVAAAGALIAFGKEQDSQISAANTGGIIGFPGGAGSANVDSQLAALTPGELVVPRNNFDEVVEGAAQQRGFVRAGENIDPDTGESLDNTASGGGQTINVSVGTFVGTDEFVQNNVIPAIRNAVQFTNANLGI